MIDRVLTHRPLLLAFVTCLFLSTFFILHIYIFTREPWQDVELLQIGTKAHRVPFNYSDIVDFPIADHHTSLVDDTFNLAILRLPEKSKWDYVGVARAPQIRRDWLSVKGGPTYQQTLIA